MERDPYRYFRIEGRELAEELGKGVLALEKGPPSAELIGKLLRLAHTLKGAARVVKLIDIADAAHAIEDALAPWRDGGTPSGPPPVEKLLALIDTVSRRMTTLGPRSVTPMPGPILVAPAEEPAHAPRAESEDLDTLLDNLGEVGVQLAGARRGASKLDSVRLLAERLAERLGRSRELADALATTSELRDELAGLARELGSGLEQAERELGQTRESAERLRLVPASVMFAALERTARDVAVSLGKNVGFVGSGGDVRLDAGVLTQVQRALVQAVRNAVAHGIESPAGRSAAGKPGLGTVRVEISRRGSRLGFVCVDDGAGVDVEAVRHKAMARDPRAAGFAPAELLELLLAGGISTAAQLSEVAGRGVGLDVARETAARLGGKASLSSERGRGTRLEMTLPLSLSSLDTLLVASGNRKLVLPLDRVRRTLRTASSDLVHTGDGPAVLVDGRLVPFAPLSRLLRRPTAQLPAHITVVLVESDGALAALGVDRLLACENVVVRPLPELVPADPLVAGACLDGVGNPRLVLDAAALVAAVRSSAARAPRAPLATRLPPILVIDDSLTTRMLEQSILESAGYEVNLATSGEEALEKARLRRYGLFLVDVEMPGMDGFTFIATSRADPELRDVPAILVTSRSAPEDRARGVAVGAQAYVAKGEFDQRRLLERIRALVRPV